MRPDPIRDQHPISSKRRTRFSASELRGFRLLPKGIFPACVIRATSNQVISNTSSTKVLFDTSDYDSPGDDGSDDSDAKMADLTNERIIIRYAGLYHLNALITYAANATGYREIKFTVNGVSSFSLHPVAAVTGNTTTPLVSVVRHFDVDDFIEVFTFQDSGGNLSLLATGEGIVFSAAWMAL